MCKCTSFAGKDIWVVPNICYWSFFIEVLPNILKCHKNTKMSYNINVIKKSWNDFIEKSQN